MDAQYLKKNVNEALSEALSSLVAVQPEDSVEYIGNFLLQYVERKNTAVEQLAIEAKIETMAVADAARLEEAEAVAIQKQFEIDNHKNKLTNFIDGFGAFATSKQDAMNKVTNFVADYMEVPACYVGVVRKNGETECVHYYGANSTQRHILGQKLPKPVDEGEETAPRQGVVFNAFKLPEVPEEEPVELAEGEEPPPPKPAPTVQPLVIDNVMRDPNVKFFGIPKIGSFLAIPLSYQSVDHEAGCNPDAPEPNKIKCDMVLCIDTMGKYKEMKPADVEIASEVGKALAVAFENIENSMFTKHQNFLAEYKEANSNVTSGAAKIADAETAAIAVVTGALPEGSSEGLKAWKEAEASLKAWTEAVVESNMFCDAIASLSGHLLPCPPAVNNLFYAVALTCGVASSDIKDICGDITWEAIRVVS